MKSSIAAALALSFTCAPALPVMTDSGDELTPQFSVSRFDMVPSASSNGIGAVGSHGWLFSASNSPKSSMLRVYQNNAVLGGHSGSAWIVELRDDVTANQAKALTNIHNVLSERPRRPLLGRPFHQSKSPNGGLGAALGRPGSLGSNAPLAPSSQGPSSGGGGGGQTITALTTQVGEIIGDRVGEPIGSAIGSAIGKAVGQPLGRTIGGAIGSAITNLLPAPR